MKINAENSVKDTLKNYLINGYDYNYLMQIYKDTSGILGKDYDDEIKLLTEKLQKYQKVKSGMMEELLTGKVRLI